MWWQKSEQQQQKVLKVKRVSSINNFPCLNAI